MQLDLFNSLSTFPAHLIPQSDIPQYPKAISYTGKEYPNAKSMRFKVFKKGSQYHYKYNYTFEGILMKESVNTGRSDKHDAIEQGIDYLYATCLSNVNTSKCTSTIAQSNEFLEWADKLQGTSKAAFISNEKIYVFNPHGVCVNPDYVYKSPPHKLEWNSITVEIATNGKSWFWGASYAGAGIPCSKGCRVFTTREEAEKVAVSHVLERCKKVTGDPSKYDKYSQKPAQNFIKWYQSEFNTTKLF